MKKQIKEFRILVLLVVFLVAGSASMFAQTDLIKWGVEQEYTKKGLMYDMKIIAVDSSNIYFYADYLKVLSYKGYLVKHEKSTGLNTLVELKSEVNEYTLEPLLRKYYGNQYHEFSSYYNKKTSKVFIFHQTYNLAKLEPNNDIKKVAEVDFNELSGGSDFSKSNCFLVFDNNQFLLRYSCEAKKKKVFGLEVFDLSFQSKWKNSSFAETEEGVNFESDYKIDDEGNVYAIQRNYEDEKDVNKHFERSRVWVVYYPRNGGASKAIPLILKDDKFITKQRLIVNKAGDVVCAGLYANPGTISAVGCFSFLLESKMASIKSVNTKEFSAEILIKGKDFKTADKSMDKIVSKKDFDKDFIYLPGDSVYCANDGSFSITYEKFKSFSQRNGDLRTNSLYYDDLFVLTFLQDGTIKWIQKISKYEYVENSSEYLVLNGSEIAQYFGYYDQQNNLHFIFNLYNEDTSSKKASTVEITLDTNGNEKFRELNADPEVAGITCPKYFFKVDNNTVVTTKYYYKILLEGVGRSKNKITFGELKIQ